VYDKFDGVYKPTTKSREHKMLEISDRKRQVVINDIFGYDKMNAWIADLTRKCDGFILVFSLSKYESFEAITRIINMIQSIKNKKASKLPIIVVGNKKDSKNVKVSEYELDNLKNKFNVEVLKVSAMTGEGVREVFVRLVEKYDLCKAQEREAKMVVNQNSSCCWY
jgi:GTPase SAR1 family protein